VNNEFCSKFSTVTTTRLIGL